VKTGLLDIVINIVLFIHVLNPDPIYEIQKELGRNGGVNENENMSLIAFSTQVYNDIPYTYSHLEHIIDLIDEDLSILPQTRQQILSGLIWIDGFLLGHLIHIHFPYLYLHGKWGLIYYDEIILLFLKFFYNRNFHILFKQIQSFTMLKKIAAWMGKGVNGLSNGIEDSPCRMFLSILIHRIVQQIPDQ